MNTYCAFDGGSCLGDSNYTFDKFLRRSSKKIVVMGPHLHFLAQNAASIWPKLSDWLAGDPKNRSMRLYISHNLKYDPNKEATRLLEHSKQVFGSWMEQAQAHNRVLALEVRTLPVIIRTSITVVNPNSPNAFSVVVPLFKQSIAPDKFFIVVRRKLYPGVFNSIWDQVGKLCEHSKALGEERL
jgi:hypothetical protein